VLDHEAILDYSELLADDIVAAVQEISHEQELDRVEDHAELLRSCFGYEDLDAKVWIDVPIVMSSEATSESTNDGDLIVSSSIRDRTIEIVINGSYHWSKLQDKKSILAQELYKFLLCDLTTLDEQRQNDKNGSFVEDLTDEALARAGSFERANRHKNPTRDMVLDNVRAGRSFERLDGMGVRDRVKALKAMYSALIDGGHV